MSEHYDKSTPTPRGQEWVLTRIQPYPPPEDADQYASRALPLLPILTEPRPLSPPSSSHNIEEDYTPRHLLASSDGNGGRKRTAFAGEIGESALAMAQPPQISIPTRQQSDEHPDVVSPQPQRPDSKLLSMWANGDELVSPIDTPGTSNWRNYIVSPLSEGFEGGTASEAGPAPTYYESWFDDTSSDEDERPGPSNPAGEKSQSLGGAFLGESNGQLPKPKFRYSDPGSPLSPGFGIDGFGEPGPDVGGSNYFDNASGRQTAQPQMHSQSTNSGGEQNYPQEINIYLGEPKISFAMPKIDSFSSNRPRASQRPVPPPLKLGADSVQEEFVKTPFPPRPSSAGRASNLDELSMGQQRRRSGLVRFGSLRRPSRQNSPKPPPGFTEILSQLDKQGVVSPTPRTKSILAKAKQGLGIGSDESKREKRRDEFRRQVRGNAE